MATLHVQAQEGRPGAGQFITGVIVDAAAKPLPGAYVSLQASGGEVLQAVSTDLSGNFGLNRAEPGTYLLEVTYLGFETLRRDITVGRQPLRLGELRLSEGALDLDGVEVVEKVLPSMQKGDTTQFNADAFKTMPDASAEDLVTKIPTVTMENGQLKAQGENVQRVLVDGKPFFGNDPSAALKNLPAEVISKIQVFDQQSDQSNFTGFNDGNTVKTINIITKSSSQQGQFGKIYGGYGYEDGNGAQRYQAGGNINIFNGAQRISIIGMSNNINQQNFASEDLLGVVGSSNRGGRGGGRGGRGGRPGGSGSDFLVQERGGIATTHAFGLNYSDKWGKKIDASGSYFFNRTNNEAENIVNRQFSGSEDFEELYTENSLSTTQNNNHRLNFNIEYKIDSSNTIIMRPQLSIQQNMGNSQTLGQTLQGGFLANSSDNLFTSDLSALNFNNNILWQHKFGKARRTFSINVSNGYAPKRGDNNLLSKTTFGAVADTLDQKAFLDANNWNVATTFSYTEPVGKQGMLMIDYEASLQQEESDQRTFDFWAETQAYDLINEQLSNVFSNDYIRHRPSLGYNYTQKGLTVMLRAGAQWATLNNEQSFPSERTFSQPFFNVLPTAMVRYDVSTTESFRFFYRSSTQLPAVNQLQNVLNNSNPLLLSVGNPDLRQSVRHGFFTRYSRSNTEKSSTFFALLAASASEQFIANSTYLSGGGFPIFDEFGLNPGVQISRPVNLNGAWDARTYITYGIPVKLIQSNVNFDLSGNYSNTPGLINEAVNYAQNSTIGAGLTLSSNISKTLDFSLSSRTNYNMAENTLQTNNNNVFLTQNSRLRFNWIVGAGIVFRTDVTHQYLDGLAEGFDQNFWLWNMSIGRKVFKNDRGEINLSVFDLLNQNVSVNRTVTETFIEDVRTNVLQRYVMLNFVYDLRHFRVK